MMVSADIAQGQELETLFDRFLYNEDVAYLHLHNAARGCFLAQVERR
jgi:hypothetical protein